MSAAQIKSSDTLTAALALPTRQTFKLHLETVKVLREKGYTWRYIASFLNERGVRCTHTTVMRRYVMRRYAYHTTDTIPAGGVT